MILKRMLDCYFDDDGAVGREHPGQDGDIVTSWQVGDSLPSWGTDGGKLAASAEMEFPVAPVRDELIASCLTSVYLCRDEEFAFLVRAGKQLANLLRDDPERLAALLRKLEP